VTGITPCTWQLSCSPCKVSRASAPGRGGGSGSEYQLQGKLWQLTCAAAWPPAPPPVHCSPLCLRLEINTNGQGGHCFSHFAGTTLAPYAKRFEQRPEAGGRDAPTAWLGCSFCSWPCLPPGGFPAPSRASVSVENSQSACMQSLLLQRKFYVA